MRESETGVLKIALLGPESSGKTTLCRKLAAVFDTVYAHEAVRGFLRRGGQILSREDLYLAALKQLRVENARLKKAKHFLFCDTELINLKVWSEQRFGACDPRLLNLINVHKYDLYLLTHPNIPWSMDDIRTGKASRSLLLDVYRNELISNETPFFEVRLIGKQRCDQVENYLKNLIS